MSLSSAIDAPVPYDLGAFDDGSTPPDDPGDTDTGAGEPDGGGAAPMGYAAPGSVSYGPTSIPGVHSKNATVESASGLIFGAILYAILINYLRGGPTQVKKWILAKLINRTATSNAATGGSGLSPNAGAGGGAGGGGGGSF